MNYDMYSKEEEARRAEIAEKETYRAKEEARKVNEAPLNEIVIKSTAIANEVLHMTCCIKEHLFGGEDDTERKPLQQPVCLRDELKMQADTLHKAMIELETIGKMLGV